MTSSDTWDVIVIGGGHNGLACAVFLAKTGRKVLVLEAAEEFGGAARTHEFHPGFRASMPHLLNRLHPEVVKGLDLIRHGLDLKAAKPCPSVALSPERGPVVLGGDYGDRLYGAISDADRAGWAELRALLIRQAEVLKPFLTRRPPDLGAASFGDASALGLAAINLRRLGREGMRDFLRMMLMNVADVAEEFLADDRLKGLLAFDAVLGAHLGPRSPTSLLGLHYRLSGDVGGQPGAQLLPAGGMGGVADAFVRAAEAAGCTLRGGAEIVRIDMEQGRATGVTLADGASLRARTVVSAINPRTTLLDLVGPRHLDTGVVRKVRNIRMKGDVAKLHLALDRVPGFVGVAGDDLAGRLVVAPSVDHVENAFNPAKYGGFPDDPVMEITLPSVADPSLAPDGACVLSANVQYAPYGLAEGWEIGRPKLLAAVLRVLEDNAPGIGASVLHAELLTPTDIEARYRMPGGHWHHGELQVDQMLVNRPFHGAAGYDTPVEGLFLCGAGSHPGGGISGVPGMNAARRILAGR